LKEQLETSKPSKLSAEKIDQSVVYHFYGNNNVIASTAQTINQAARDVIISGDMKSLKKALTDFGVDQTDADKIEQALKDDGYDGK
jgi:hypothetical protein